MNCIKLLESTDSEGITKSIWMTAAYDKRDPNPQKNYGIHGAELRFLIQRGKVGVELYWMTPFHLPHVRKELEVKFRGERLFDGLGGIDYHSPVPLWEGQTGRDDCRITGGCCYSDGTATGAGELFDHAVADPEEIWKTLTEWLVDTEKRVKEQEELVRNMT